MNQQKQELNITPKPTKNKTKEALKATQAKERLNRKKRLKRLTRPKRLKRLKRLKESIWNFREEKMETDKGDEYYERDQKIG